MSVNQLIKAELEEITELCQRYRVSRLDLFGAATSDRFDPERSDLDFLVEFEAMSPVDISHSYLGLLVDLEKLFGRAIDLVTTSSIENPYFKANIERSRQLLYAA